MKDYKQIQNHRHSDQLYTHTRVYSGNPEEMYISNKSYKLIFIAGMRP